MKLNAENEACANNEPLMTMTTPKLTVREKHRLKVLNPAVPFN
ncbi:hypothetical protein A33Q_0342 [Indibacter alkaliphilus LW1]|uniref:Uncharacterized protein n=1 Tax=Indibacter alkaliphilus (strain CCUG 57479 / KCTC 22604 / LW1) TaxID=1189612 RepID=S2E502_INDAL|nr:hypothetical protein A33Q_0342 [Indibacter alkaliphilus LW1]